MNEETENDNIKSNILANDQFFFTTTIIFRLL